MPNLFTIAGLNGGKPNWMTNDDLEALKAEAYKAIQSAGGGYAWFVINGKLCKISKPIQVFYMENPEAGQPPIVLKPPEAPTFDESGKVEFLVERPPIDGD